MAHLVYKKPLQSESHREDYKALRKAKDAGQIDPESYKSAKKNLLAEAEDYTVTTGGLASSRNSLRRTLTNTSTSPPASISTSASSESPTKEWPRKGSILERNDVSRLVFKPEHRSHEAREAAKEERKLRKALETERAARAESFKHISGTEGPSSPVDPRASRTISISSSSGSSNKSLAPKLGIGFRFFGRKAPPVGLEAPRLEETYVEDDLFASKRRRAGSLGTIVSEKSGLSSGRGNAGGRAIGEDQRYLRTVADYILVGKPSPTHPRSHNSSRSGTVSRRHSFASQHERPSFSSVRPDSSASQPTRPPGGIIFTEDGRLRFRNQSAGEPEEVSKPPLSAALLNQFTQFLVTFSNTSRLFTFAKYGTVRRGSMSMHSRSAIDYDAEDSETDDFFMNSDESFVHLRGILERRTWFLSAMKWLSFERVLFSPAHHLMTIDNGCTILDLDGGGIANWSWHLSLTYPASNIHSLLLPTSPRSPPTTTHPPNLTLITAPTLTALTTIPSASFDVIVSHFLPRIFLSTSASTPHDQQILQILHELHRVLKPSGYLELTIVDPLLNNMGPLTSAYIANHILPASTVTQGVIKPSKGILKALKSMGPTEGGMWTEVKTCDMWMPTTSIGDELSTVTSRVGRFLYDELYLTTDGGAVLPEGVVEAKDGGMWADAGIVEECGRENTAFKWAKCYARKA
ncbi:hypothetical protein L873DRAFT_1818601 [Choiromyces venosus 120613-1]|uniref:Methyltransferase type 11 domain-containing protein n=1 Tax=Choiromyces venosus 120613-1 TaxID=1336337 RepID=A0A3N4J442_9PEZI|nr:hypothetical protein L873DRAFT_1818601 [Choiromyces venosus 120613-1]